MQFPSRLYPILDIELTGARGHEPLDVLSAWLDAGVRLAQLRAKTLPGGEFLALADEVVARCRTAGARCLVNDRVDIALMSAADGVHVGQLDLPASSVRALVGRDAWIGLSTHDDRQMAAACREPVSYVAIGPVFGTSTKADPDPEVGLAGVARAAAIAHGAGLAVVAIGGITLDTAPRVIDAGADAVAIISDLLSGDPSTIARRFLAAPV
jgi:thiamine-phosphate pyrophosphorylase